MGTDVDKTTEGIDLIVRNFFLQLGHNQVDLRTALSDKLLVANVRTFLSPAEKALQEQGNGRESLHELRDKLFRNSEHILRERIGDFLGKPVQRIHYIYGVNPEEMDIIMFLE